MSGRILPARSGLGLELFSLTPGVLRMTGSAAAMVSFEESSGLLKELAGVEVGVSQAQRAAEALGAEIANDERRCVEPAGASAPTIYLGMDGTGVPMPPLKSPAAPASSRMARRKLARPSLSPCGLPNRATRWASLSGMRGQSLIRPPSKARRSQTPAPPGPISRTGCSGGCPTRVYRSLTLRDSR